MKINKLNAKRIISLVAILIIIVALTVGNVIAGQNAGLITDFLCGGGTSFGTGEVEGSDALCQELEKEGIVMLKNDNITSTKKTLPFDEDIETVNVFGWGGTDAGFVQLGVGSGSSPIFPSKSISLLTALKNAGIRYNTDLIDAYKNFYSGQSDGRREWDRNTAEVYRLYEPSRSFYTRDMLWDAEDFSDVALVVISRISGENTAGEVPTVQNKLYTQDGLQAADNTRTYLELTRYEEELINMCYDSFPYVVLIINSSNTMHISKEMSDKCNAIISVGVAGQSGAAAIPDLLWGKTSPSGKLASTHVYDGSTEASYANHTTAGGQIQYVEDIYVGYKWYETADAEGFWDSSFAKNKWKIENGYEDVVAYPFGYGLTYTNFEWEVSNLSLDKGSTLSANSTISFDVTVRNVGNFPAKDVVQVYITAPYKKGSIEKAHVKLVAFFKTPELPADRTVAYTEKITLSIYDFASYDCYDKNANDFRGYEVEYVAGKDYQVKLMTDAHTLKNCQDNVISYKVPTGGIQLRKDVTTGNDVENRFTGTDTYTGHSTDGTTLGVTTKYMSRNDFTTTFPTTHATASNQSSTISSLNNFLNPAYDQTTMPTTGVEANLRLVTKADGSYLTKSELSGGTSDLKVNEELFEELSDYDSEVWEEFINQMSVDELKTLVQDGGFETKAIASIGKPTTEDRDGPAGLNEVILGNFSGRQEWTAFPGENVIACTWNVQLIYQMGLMLAEEASNTAVGGWYAPTVNLYRSAYNGRNYESYSEDGVLSGKMAAGLIKGAKTGGLYCYMKHFVLSELGVNPLLVETWITEQNLRENYLKPFEIAVKEGEANAIMSSFNCVGATWAGAHYGTLTQVLRHEWDFKGSVITDYTKSGMNANSGIRAGNDLWLNPRGVGSLPATQISTSNATEMYCAKMSAKNIVYTYVSTYTYAKHNDPNFTIKVADAVFPWWIPVLVGIDVVAVAGCGLWTYFVLFRKKKGETV